MEKKIKKGNINLFEIGSDISLFKDSIQENNKEN
jgi:hypothetical protein